MRFIALCSQRNDAHQNLNPHTYSSNQRESVSCDHQNDNDNDKTMREREKREEREEMRMDVDQECYAAVLRNGYESS